jgi:catechol 2,3-dioxygenase
VVAADQGRSGAPPYGIAPPAFRLPDATCIGGVCLQVGDLQRSVRFYERVIGLEAHHLSADTAALAPHGAARPLVTLRTAPGVKPAQRGAFGLYHFAILLPDRAALGRFAAHLASVGVRVATADHLVSETFYLWDPDGLGIEVYADRPRGEWQVRGRELAMTTEPLNVASVIAAAGGEAWSGMPPATTIGHVHLHVGSLELAEAFYHRALGFDKTVWSYPGALFMSAGGYHHHLATNVWAPGPAPDPDRAQLLDWALVVPSAGDADDIGQRLRADGYSATDGPGGVTAVDPWQTRIRILAQEG